MKLDSGAEVKLMVAGVAVQEYQSTSEDDNPKDGQTCTRYVEAISGSNFALHLSFPTRIVPMPAKDCIRIQVYLDGKHATSRVLQGTYRTSPFLLEGIDEMSSRGRELQRFTFAQLTTHDCPPTANTKPEQFQDLGVVAVKCTWCRVESATYHQLSDAFQPAAGTSISEKVLKGRAISNQANVAKPVLVPGAVGTVNTSNPYGPNPFATFKFKYRSRKDLQIEGIIEQDPEPVPLEDRDPAALTPDEVRQLQLRLQAKQEDMIRVKKEKRAWVDDDEADDDDEAVVVTKGPSTKKRRPDDSVPVIDLTED